MRKETLQLIRVPTDATRRGAKAKKHKSDNDPAWQVLYALLSDVMLDEQERGMYEGYAKYLLSNGKLSPKMTAWLERRSAPGFEVIAHNNRMRGWKGESRINPRNGSHTICLACASWDVEDKTDECAHKETVTLKHNEHELAAAVGMAEDMVRARSVYISAKTALIAFVKQANGGTLEK